MVRKNAKGQVTWDSWDSDPSLLSADGRPYWLRSPPTPPLLRRDGSARASKWDGLTLDLFPDGRRVIPMRRRSR